MTTHRPGDHAAPNIERGKAPDEKPGSSRAQRDGFDLRRYIEGPRAFTWIGVGLLGAFVIWLFVSLQQQPLPRAVPLQPDYLKNRITYVQLQPFMGLDFQHNYAAARTWRQGKDPYAEMHGDPVFGQYTYPPLTLVAFSWTDLFPPGPLMRFNGTNGYQADFAASVPAILTWMAMIIGAVFLASMKSWKIRQQLGLPLLPLHFVLGAALASYPVLFELERGNCNVLPLLAIVALVAVLEWPDRRRGDIVAGLCIAAATGIKPYAIILLVGLVALRRFRAIAFALGWLLFEAIVFSPDLRRWMEIAKVQNQAAVPFYLDYSHSLISHWQLIARDLHWPQLAQLPAQTLVSVGLFGVIVAVAWRVFRRHQTLAIAWPFFLWLTAMATFVSPISNDYNLLFIPLAVLSVWSAADSWRLQLCVGSVLLWWQPFFIGLSNLPWLLLKAVGVMLVGILLVRRVETMAPPNQPSNDSPMRVA